MFGYGIGTGAGNNLGSHSMVALMIMNGGGLFTPDGKADCVTDRNIESMDLVRQMVSEGIIDPASVSYTTDNLNTQWAKSKVALGFNSAALLSQAAAVADDLEVVSPIAGPHGDKATLHFVNSIMMYTKTPSQDASEAFMTYYFKNIHQYWDAGLVGGVPVLKSITDSEAFKKSPVAGQDRQGVHTDRHHVRGHGHQAVRRPRLRRRWPGTHPVRPDHAAGQDGFERSADEAADRHRRGHQMITAVSLSTGWGG